jgi:hypothetical protein
MENSLFRLITSRSHDTACTRPILLGNAGPGLKLGDERAHRPASPWTDINDIVREARTALGAGYDKDTLAGYALPRLSADQIDALVAEALWNRSLGIRAVGPCPRHPESPTFGRGAPTR